MAVRIVVAGAGLGGLAVAVGLARGGHRVTVLEGDESPASRPQGYRLHLDARGLEPLRDLLPAAAFELVQQTSGTFAEPRRLEVLSGRLKHLKTVATGPARADGRLVSTAVDRGTLRAILLAVAAAAGVEIRWSTPVSGYVDSGPGPLVVNDTGAGSIVGRSPVAAASPKLLERLDHGYVVLRGLRTGIGLGLLRFGRRPDDAGAAAGIPLAAVDDYVMWNVGLRTRVGLEGLSPVALQQKAFQCTRGWHADVATIGDAARPVAAVRDVDGADRAELVAAIGPAERAMVEVAFGVSEAGPATSRR